MKIKILLLSIVFSCVLLLSGCVNYDEILKQQTGESEDKSEEEKSKIELSLGDINDDGRVEKLVLHKEKLNLYSEARLCGKFDLSEEYDYSSLSAYVSDIDGDSENEIVVMMNCETRESSPVFNVRIINQYEDDRYELWDFPEEITSNFADSGFSAEVTVKDKFLYSVRRDTYNFDIDVSGIYGLSLLDKEGLEKAEEQWKKIEKSNYYGEALGIYSINILCDSEGNNTLYVYEYITGGDDKTIGSLVFNVAYDKKGKYSIESVMLKK